MQCVENDQNVLLTNISDEKNYGLVMHVMKVRTIIFIDDRKGRGVGLLSTCNIVAC